MEELIHSWVAPLPLPVIFLIIVAALFTLAKGADLLVDEAVTLSKQWGVPTVIIGATIVSLGTTLPEAAVSVAAAIQGSPGLALGNAVGSIITDCGLILGLAAVLAPLPLDREIVNRQGWIQVGAGVALVLFALPWLNLGGVFSAGGNVPQWAGFVLVAGLFAYLYFSIRSARAGVPVAAVEQVDEIVPDEEAAGSSRGRTIGLLLLGIVLVLLGAQVLIPSVQISAVRMGIPEAIIAATLVALGTSLPELVTALNAVRKGHGELAVGNVIGADILNVLFVAGVSAAVTPVGLAADPRFFKVLFPGMLALLIVFRIGVYFQRTHLTRAFGVVLLLLYASIVTISYFV